MPWRENCTESLHKCMSVQNEEELRNVWAAGWEACPSLLTGWWTGGCCKWMSGWLTGWGCCRGMEMEGDAYEMSILTKGSQTQQQGCISAIFILRCVIKILAFISVFFSFYFIHPGSVPYCLSALYCTQFQQLGLSPLLILKVPLHLKRCFAYFSSMFDLPIHLLKRKRFPVLILNLSCRRVPVCLWHHTIAEIRQQHGQKGVQWGMKQWAVR